MQPVIYHICSRQEWDLAQVQGEYRADSLETEGFIHCSTREQVLFVANRRFRAVSGLVLLAIDSGVVPSQIRYENLEGGSRLFPHIYGPIPVSAVRSVGRFEAGIDGVFAWPDDPELWQEQA
jgi:uncharacterized protein (DUF952 family)